MSKCPHRNMYVLSPEEVEQQIDAIADQMYASFGGKFSMAEVREEIPTLMHGWCPDCGERTVKWPEKTIESVVVIFRTEQNKEVILRWDELNSSEKRQVRNYLRR